MALEVVHDWDGVIATFDGHPRYELYGAGGVFDGEEAVRGYFAAARTPFPDQGNEIIAISHAEDTVLVEFWLTGTHLGPLTLHGETHPPTGKSSRIRMAASFEFALGSDRIRCERPYFDARRVAAQLGWGKRQKILRAQTCGTAYALIAIRTAPHANVLDAAVAAFRKFPILPSAIARRRR